MIIVRISGGLGNQMFQYATARSLSLKHGVQMKLDLSFYSHQTLRKYSLNQFRIEEKIASKAEIELFKGKENPLGNLLRKFGCRIESPSFYIRDTLLLNSATYTKNTFDANIFTNVHNAYLDGYWQNELYFKDFKQQIFKDFSFKENYSLQYLSYANQIQNLNSISIHVRRGDYVNSSMFKGSSLAITNLDFYQRSYQCILEKVKKASFFIFSDDIPWCKENLHFISNAIYIEGLKNDVEELVLMSKCKHNIISNSTFSWWGAWLNQNSFQIVLAPRIWFKTNQELNIAAKDWHLL